MMKAVKFAVFPVITGATGAIFLHTYNMNHVLTLAVYTAICFFAGVWDERISEKR